MWEVGVKFFLKKCFLLKICVKYVGYIVLEKGIEFDEEKVLKVLGWF